MKGNLGGASKKNDKTWENVRETAVNRKQQKHKAFFMTLVLSRDKQFFLAESMIVSHFGVYVRYNKYRS